MESTQKICLEDRIRGIKDKLADFTKSEKIWGVIHSASAVFMATLAGTYMYRNFIPDSSDSPEKQIFVSAYAAVATLISYAAVYYWTEALIEE